MPNIFFYGGWKKQGIIEIPVDKILNKVAVRYRTIEGFTNNIVTFRTSEFSLTKEEALMKVNIIITKEIESKERAISRLIEIRKNLK